MKVIKRDGRNVEFDKNKIKEAIEKAYKEVHPDEDNEVIVLAIADVIELILQYQKVNEVNIEQIQDMVETELMNKDKDLYYISV